METMLAVDSVPIHQKPSNYDEISMQQSVYFGDSLKDLKNLRMQLYSAADYFEVSYTNNEQKSFVADTLKEYAIKALVNTVDHLGSVTYKVNGILDENVEEVSETEFCVSCIEQRLRTCQEYIDREGVAEQSSVINTPRYHKRYTLPGNQSFGLKFTCFTTNSFMTMLSHSSNLLLGDGGGGSTSAANVKFQGYHSEDMEDWHRFRTAVRPTVREAPSKTFRKGRSVSPSVRRSKREPESPSARPSRPPPAETFSSIAPTAPKKELDRRSTDKRSVSPHRFPLQRCGSLATKPTSKPNSRSTTPNHRAIERQRFPSAPRRSTSMHVQKARESDSHQQQELQRAPSRSKRLFKALLGRKKSKKDETLYTYLDEY